MFITKPGKGKAPLMPCQLALKKLFGCAQGTVIYLDDSLESTEELWDAEK